MFRAKIFGMKRMHSSSDSTVQAGARRAVLVGINAYQGQPLFGCVSDILAVKRFLIDQREFPAEHVRVLLDHDATRGAILVALDELSRVSRPGDEAVFYFCGHGVRLPTGDPMARERYDEALCPVEFDWTAKTALLDDELRAIFDSFAEGVAITWVMDACHAGELEEELDLRVLAARRMCPPPEQWHLTRRVALSAPEHCTVIRACADDERAGDLYVDHGARGVFTYHWLEAARQAPEATCAELLRKVERELEALGQHPQVSGPGLHQPFVSAPPAVRSARASDTATEWMLQALASPGLDRRARRGRDTASPLSATCRAFWWGFQLELSHDSLEWLATAGSPKTMVQTFELLLDEVPERALPHLPSLIEHVAREFSAIYAHNQGFGVMISMSAFEPDVFVTTAITPRSRRSHSAEIPIPH